MTTSDRLLTAFTPSIMSHETLEAIFVRREALTSHIMKDIGTSATTRSKRHVLLVGPRGIGKTHLVSLVFHRAKADPALSDRLRIAWMREEMWEVASFLDLLECIISALATEYGDDGLAAVVDELKTLSVQDAERSAERLLLDYLKDRILLILIENLDEVFGALAEIGERQLRAFLQNHTNTIVVGTTPGLFSGVSDHDSPFYGFFNVTHLDELTIDDATLLLHKIADLRKDAELAAFVDTEAGHDRLAAVQHLAGGHPRIWIFFAGIVTHETLDELVPAFLGMLDDLTPYYQSRMKELPAQQRKVISFLCARRGSAVVKDIAEACRLSPQAAAAQLHDLREKGFVRSESAGRESWYELREPLLRLVLEVKESRARPIRLIVNFLRNWYSRPELRSKYESTPTQASITRDYLSAALDLQGFPESKPHSTEYFREDPGSYTGFASHEADKTIRDTEQAIKHEGSAATPEMWNALGIRQLALGRGGAAIESFDRAIVIVPGDSKAHNNRGNALTSLGRYEEAIQSYNRSIKFEPGSATAYFNRGVALHAIERYGEAVDSYDRAIEIDPNNSSMYDNRSLSLSNMQRYGEALISCDRAIELAPTDDKPYAIRGFVLDSAGRVEEAIASYKDAIACTPTNSLHYLECGGALIRIRRFNEAIEYLERSIELDPHNAYSYFCRGTALEELARLVEAIESYNTSLSIEPNETTTYNNLGTALGKLYRYAEAIESFSRAIELDPFNAKAYHNRAMAFENSGNYIEAINDCEKCLEIKPDDAREYGQWARSLAALDRWPELLVILDRGFATSGGDGDWGDEEGYCWLMLVKSASTSWVGRSADLVELYLRHDALKWLGQGLIRATPALFEPGVSASAACLWNEAWAAAGRGYDDMDVPLRLLDATVRWKEKPDRRILLALPEEERRILQEILPKQDEKPTDVVGQSKSRRGRK